MKHFLPLAALPLATLVLAAPALAAEPVLAPGEIVAAAPKADWVAIAASDLLVMDLAPPAQGPGQASAEGKPRRVVIQLMPPPFSQGWIGNIRKFAAAHWWDGLSINRVQDNYVVQWGDADGEDKAKAKALPEGLVTISESAYSIRESEIFGESAALESPSAEDERWAAKDAEQAANERVVEIAAGKKFEDRPSDMGDLPWQLRDSYSQGTSFIKDWAVASQTEPLDRIPMVQSFWPVHCYGMVGVGRDMPPNTGSGAELYTVIGHAPRHLDRNIALVGRVIEGIEHLSSLPRGTGALGFYETPEERTGISSVRIGDAVAGLPAYEYLSTESATFARYADARANRRDAFFIRPAGGADICNIPVPVRRVGSN